MPSKTVAYRAFLASPGGLEPEREAIREEIKRFNGGLMHELGAAFTAVGWETVPGSMKRPQAVINEELAKCDFMILVLWNRWGTAPDLDGRFTSGTEEEFEVASELLNDTASAMGDILVLFKGVPEAQLNDPGDQLKRVLEFKSKLEASKSCLYKTFDTIDELRIEVATRLKTWAKGQAHFAAQDATPDGEVVPDHRAAPAIVPPDSVAALESHLERAERYAAQGQVTQAEAMYAQATVDGDLVALESYSKFLRRVGRPNKSVEICRDILRELAGIPESVENSVQMSRILANVGITERKLGHLRQSRATLFEAVQAIRGGSSEELEGKAYALDNLGITALRTGDLQDAQESFQDASDIRDLSGSSEGRAQSKLNLARVEGRLGNYEVAADLYEKATELLGEDQLSLRAAAKASLGQTNLAQGDLEAAEVAFREALRLNETIGQPGNVALSELQLARVLMVRGKLTEAYRFASRAHEDNRAASNREGVVSAQQALAEIAGKTGRPDEAMGLLEDCVDAYVAMGNPTGEGWARFRLATLQDQFEQSVEAAGNFARARELAVITRNASLSAELDDREQAN